jgi:hypothetical protein
MNKNVINEEELKNKVMRINEIVKTQYDKNIAYTNLIILAGYGGLFSLWYLTKEYLSRFQALSAGLFLLISILVFVLYEIYKMYFVSGILLKKIRILNSLELRNKPELILEKISEIENIHETQMPKLNKIWHISLFLTVGAGLIGVGILIFSYIAGIIKWN